MGLLEGRIAIITGAGGSLGSAGAKLFTCEGAKVLVNDVNAESGELVVREITQVDGVEVADTHSIDSVKGCEAILAHCRRCWASPTFW